jgi:hypothetical protein
MTDANSIKTLLLPLADALHMDLKYRGKLRRLYGHLTMPLPICGLVDLTQDVPIAIVDSGVYPVAGMAGALLRIMGNLYVLMLSDTETQQLTMMLLDGSVLGFNKDMAGDGIKLFSPSSWSRIGLYGVIAPGVRAVYTRQYLEEDWTEFPDGPKAIKDYVVKRHENLGAQVPDPFYI